jgi:hypothetical protein
MVEFLFFFPMGVEEGDAEKECFLIQSELAASINK